MPLTLKKRPAPAAIGKPGILTLKQRPGVALAPLPSSAESSRPVLLTTHELALLQLLVTAERKRLQELFGERLGEYPTCVRDVERLARIRAVIRQELGMPAAAD